MTYTESQGRDSYFGPSDSPHERLAMIMDRDVEKLKLLTSSTEHLTIKRLARVDPDLADRAEKIADSDMLWPDEASAVLNGPSDIRLKGYIGEDADFAFVEPIIKDGSWAYNNYFLNLQSEHRTASPQVARESFKSGDLIVLTYGTKPYVERAYALLPDFMDALQQTTQQLGGMDNWNEAMVEGYLDPYEKPDEARLMKASRIAYVLLARLMRSDDSQIQHSLLGFASSEIKPITDPGVELRT